MSMRVNCSSVPSIESGDTLLKRQLTSITDTLLKASKRREEEISKWLSHSPSLSAPELTSTIPEGKTDCLHRDELNGSERESENSEKPSGKMLVGLNHATASPRTETTPDDTPTIETIQSEPEDADKESEKIHWGCKGGSASTERGSDQDHMSQLEILHREMIKMILMGPKDEQTDSDVPGMQHSIQAGTENTVNDDADCSLTDEPPTNLSMNESTASHVVTPQIPLLPYAVTIHMEEAATKWEEVRRWSTFLFSDGLDGYKARQEKERILSRSTEILDHTIKEALDDEQSRLRYRVIVTNLAADAGEAEVVYLFSEFLSQIRNIKILKERGPINRTRVAEVDMCSRESAVNAYRCTAGHIFGLCIQVNLAIATSP